jgi:hypothetical protein
LSLLLFLSLLLSILIVLLLIVVNLMQRTYSYIGFPEANHLSRVYNTQPFCGYSYNTSIAICHNKRFFFFFSIFRR